MLVLKNPPILTSDANIPACWALLHLGADLVWKSKAINELTAFLTAHTDPTSPAPFHKQLASISLTAWENELPVLELIIRETIRLSLSITALRRNVKKEIKINDVIIKPGDFLAYTIYDTHMDPEIYSDPERFDPSRYEEGRQEDKKQTFAYLGWGAGRWSNDLSCNVPLCL